MSKENDFSFSKRPSSKICFEQEKQDNPYVAEKRYIAGYAHEDLITKRSYTDILFLMFKLELPTPQQQVLLETLMKYLITAGPRCPGTRAAMAIGISKVNPEHILPISAITLGGEKSGAAEVEKAYKFLSQNIDKSPQQVLETLELSAQDSEYHPAPGFGQVYASVDPIVADFLHRLRENFADSRCIQWLDAFNQLLNDKNIGVLDTGLAAAVFFELQLGARESVGLYQLLRAPGMLAHGMEQTHRPITDMPLLEDSKYVITK